jgi:hypothetical protein
MSMAVASKLRHWLNRSFRPLNIEITALTAERNEMARLRLGTEGLFDRPAFPLLAQFAACDPAPVLKAVRNFSGKTSRFSASRSGSEYFYLNDYFTSPDAEVAYATIWESQPRCILEVGSGSARRVLAFRWGLYT